jgi:pyridoxal phosphate enzyme (YggS family)
MEHSIKQRWEQIQERIAAAAARAGRAAGEVMLIGVSKTHPASAIREAFAAGVRHFGENRVQEWEGKRAGTDGLDAEWHLIGHLQSNKAAKAAKLFQCVDSVDNFALAEKLSKAREENEFARKLRILIEVRVAQEDTKSGVEIEQLPNLAEKIVLLSHLEFAGLMCIPPFLEDPERVRPYFKALNHLRGDLEGKLGRKLPVLSMGMSHDFEVAIEEGATEIRVGTALFGGRKV